MSGSRFRTALIVAGLLALSFVPTAAAEGDDSIAWGIEYEWVNLNDDINTLTGLPYDDIITDIEGSANYSGFNLDIINVYSGVSSFYVEQWDDSTEQQVTDNSGTSHTVTTRMTEITLRHGMLYDAGILMDWADTTVMGAPSMDVVLSADYETIAVMDLLYTEYVTSDMMFVGSDLEASGNWGIGAGMGLFFDVSGNGDSFDMDLDLSYNLGWDASSITSEWRLDHPSNVLNMMNNGNEFEWECDDDCGKVTGSYATEQSYDISFTGLPMDEFGFEADALDMQISDTIPDSGTFDSSSPNADLDADFEMTYNFGEEQEITIDDSGTTTVVTEVMADPYSPGMSLMVGYSFANAIMGSGDQTTAAEAMASAMEDWAEDAGETMEFGTFVCDDGEEIPADYVNDGEDDCADGSDEGVDEGDVGSELENRAMNIGEAFMESDFLKNMETFGERLGSEMEKYEDLEIELAYVGGDYNALWSNEHSRYVGMQLIGETEAGNEYSILGPETNTYNNNPPAEIHLQYLVGEAADEAEDVAETSVTIEALAPIANHDVSAVIEALGIHAPDSMINDDSQSAGEGEDSSFSSLTTMVAVGLGALLVLIVLGVVVMLVAGRKRGGSGDVDWNAPVQSQSVSTGGSDQYHKSGVERQQEMMQTAATTMAPTTTMPSTLPTPQNPPSNIQGTMQQGHEVIEWPAGSGSWWYREQSTGQWIVWQ